MPSRIAIRLFDVLLGFLLRPRIRRVRRCSFLVTAPLGILVGRSLGLDLGDGVLLGAAAAFVDVAVVSGVALAGARLLGQERRDALLDLLMHPVARRAIIGEARMLSTLPALLVRRLRPPRGEGFAYHRGSHELGFGLALLPAMLAEGAAVHLLLPDGWFWPKVALAALHLYGMVMFVSWAVAERTQPHRLRSGELELRSGQLLPRAGRDRRRRGYRGRAPARRAAHWPPPRRRPTAPRGGRTHRRGAALRRDRPHRTPARGPRGRNRAGDRRRRPCAPDRRRGGGARRGSDRGAPSVGVVGLVRSGPTWRRRSPRRRPRPGAGRIRRRGAPIGCAGCPP